MEKNSRLEELKKQVSDMSLQQMQIQDTRKITQQKLSNIQEQKEDIEKEMEQFISNVFFKNEIASAQERQLLQDKLDRFSHRQTVMNEQLITLNDNLTDITSLKALYEAKREELELDYQNQKNALNSQIKTLEKRVESLKEEISTKTDKLDQIVADTKKASFLKALKRSWIILAVFGLVGFLALIIGGVAGWGIFNLIGNILSSIGKFFSFSFK